MYIYILMGVDPVIGSEMVETSLFPSSMCIDMGGWDMVVSDLVFFIGFCKRPI